MNIVEQIKQILNNKIITFFEKNKKRYYIEIFPEDIVYCTKILFEDLGLRFITATGIDCEDCFEILYHFMYDKTGEIISLRVKIKNKVSPEIDSVTPVIKGAEWIEREIWELLGINFKGHQNLKHLLLSDDWPEKKFPLRQEK